MLKQPSRPLIPVKIPNPVGGVIRSFGREEPPQVPHLTNSLNVLPYDLLGRKRVGQRPGTLPLYNLQDFGAPSTFIQGMLQVGSIVQPGAVIFPASTLYFSTWNAMPWTTTSPNTVTVGPTGTASTIFVFPSTQVLQVNFTVHWAVNNTGAGSGLVGTSFGIGVTSPVDLVHSRGILNWSAGMYEESVGSSTALGGTAGLFNLQADPSTQYLASGATWNFTGSYSFTGKYSYNSLTNKIHAIESITGTQTLNSSGDFTLSAATNSTVFHGWQNLYMWNQQGIDATDTLTVS